VYVTLEIRICVFLLFYIQYETEDYFCKAVPRNVFLVLGYAADWNTKSVEEAF